MQHGLNPLTTSEFAALMAQLAPFESNPIIAVAVSGGADSMALALLTHDWARASGGHAVALTVDHRLRRESTAEAEQVASWCAQAGMEHHILSLNLPRLHSSIQATARDARYRILTAFCREHHILHLLTAHHRDDQTETLLFRLARGSGIGGLAAMAGISDISGIRLLRPLLTTPKERLLDTLMAQSHPWIEDPSNDNPAYTRNVIRHNLTLLPDAHEVSQQVSQLSQSFGNARKILEYKLASQLAGMLFIYPEGYAILNRSAFMDSPFELSMGALSSAMMTLSGESAIPRNGQLERLQGELMEGVAKRSFSGLMFEWQEGAGGWLITREPNAMEGILTIRANTPLEWDNRFSVAWEGDATSVTPDELNVRGVGPHGIKMLLESDPMFFKHNSLAKSKIVLASLPAFWHLEEVIAIPHINYVASDYKNYRFTARYLPVKPLAGRGFFSLTLS